MECGSLVTEYMTNACPQSRPPSTSFARLAPCHRRPEKSFGSPSGRDVPGEHGFNLRQPVFASEHRNDTPTTTQPSHTEVVSEGCKFVVTTARLTVNYDIFGRTTFERYLSFNHDFHPFQVARSRTARWSSIPPSISCLTTSSVVSLWLLRVCCIFNYSILLVGVPPPTISRASCVQAAESCGDS
jgi:hypothetical protein